MRIAIGVDLGSTTTKAVLLDEGQRIVGRGITNSRSNYDVACQVALGEAYTNARFLIIEDELKVQGLAPQARQELIRALERGFRREQYSVQLAVLEEKLGGLVRKDDAGAAVRKAIGAIMGSMVTECDSLFKADSRRKSDFFRDLAGSRYMQLAEGLTRGSSGGCRAVGGNAKMGATFGQLAGLFDKAILLVENTPASDTGFLDCAGAARRDVGASSELDLALKRAAAVEFERFASVGTGYGRQRLPFPKKEVRSEILCHGLGAHAMFPATRTVLDIGGQDTKAIQVDPLGIVTSFQMNDRCAAGCGRYLGYIADEMNLGVHELGPLAEKATRKVKINSTCTVFAGAELRERLSLGEKREDILAGLHRAIILRAMSLLARSGGVDDEFTFTGGVARNPAATGALRTLIAENYGERVMNISPDSIYTGALGAALFACRDAEAVPA